MCIAPAIQNNLFTTEIELLNFWNPLVLKTIKSRTQFAIALTMSLSCIDSYLIDQRLHVDHPSLSAATEIVPKGLKGYI